MITFGVSLRVCSLFLSDSEQYVVFWVAKFCQNKTCPIATQNYPKIAFRGVSPGKNRVLVLLKPADMKNNLRQQC